MSFWTELSITQKQRCFNPKSKHKFTVDFIRRHKAWEVKGPLAEEFERILPLLIDAANEQNIQERIFRKNPQQREAPLGFSIYLVGKRPEVDALTPTIVTEHRDLDVAKEAAAQFRELQNINALDDPLWGYGFHFAKWDTVLTADEDGDDGDSVTASDQADTSSLAGDHEAEEVMQEGLVTSLCGAHIVIESSVSADPSEGSDNAKWTHSTIGGTLSIGNIQYAMTAAHAFPGLANLEDNPLYQRCNVYIYASSVVSVDENGLAIQAPFAANESVASAGRIYTGPALGSPQDLSARRIIFHQDDDWALIPIQSPQFQCGNTIEIADGITLQVHGAAKTKPLGSVVVASGVTKPSTTSIVGAPLALLLPGTKKLHLVWAIKRQSLPGDCGSWVVDTDGRVFAVVVATSKEQNLTFCLPFAKIVDKIMELFQGQSDDLFGAKLKAPVRVSTRLGTGILPRTNGTVDAASQDGEEDDQSDGQEEREAPPPRDTPFYPNESYEAEEVDSDQSDDRSLDTSPEVVNNDDIEVTDMLNTTARSSTPEQRTGISLTAQEKRKVDSFTTNSPETIQRGGDNSRPADDDISNFPNPSKSNVLVLVAQRLPGTNLRFGSTTFSRPWRPSNDVLTRLGYHFLISAADDVIVDQALDRDQIKDIFQNSNFPVRPDKMPHFIFVEERQSYAGVDAGQAENSSYWLNFFTTHDQEDRLPMGRRDDGQEVQQSRLAIRERAPESERETTNIYKDSSVTREDVGPAPEPERQSERQSDLRDKTTSLRSPARVVEREEIIIRRDGREREPTVIRHADGREIDIVTNPYEGDHSTSQNIARNRSFERIRHESPARSPTEVNKAGRDDGPDTTKDSKKDATTPNTVTSLVLRRSSPRRVVRETVHAHLPSRQTEKKTSDNAPTYSPSETRVKKSEIDPAALDFYNVNWSPDPLDVSKLIVRDEITRDRWNELRIHTKKRNQDRTFSPVRNVLLQRQGTFHSEKFDPDRKEDTTRHALVTTSGAGTGASRRPATTTRTREREYETRRTRSPERTYLRERRDIYESPARVIVKDIDNDRQDDVEKACDLIDTDFEMLVRNMMWRQGVPMEACDTALYRHGSKERRKKAWRRDGRSTGRSRYDDFDRRYYEDDYDDVRYKVRPRREVRTYTSPVAARSSETRDRGRNEAVEEKEITIRRASQSRDRGGKETFDREEIVIRRRRSLSIDQAYRTRDPALSRR